MKYKSCSIYGTTSVLSGLGKLWGIDSNYYFFFINLTNNNYKGNLVQVTHIDIRDTIYLEEGVFLLSTFSKISHNKRHKKMLKKLNKALQHNRKNWVKL